VRVTASPAVGGAAKLILGANVLWTTDDALSKPDFGFTGNLFSGERRMWGVDAQWILGPLDLSAEYLHGTFEPRNGIPARKFDADGWHVTGAYYLLPSRLQLFVRAEQFDPNADFGGGRFESLTLELLPEGRRYPLRAQLRERRLAERGPAGPPARPCAGDFLTRTSPGPPLLQAERLPSDIRDHLRRPLRIPDDMHGG
jgi:hypothetical protein